MDRADSGRPRPAWLLHRKRWRLGGSARCYRKGLLHPVPGEVHHAPASAAARASAAVRVARNGGETRKASVVMPLSSQTEPLYGPPEFTCDQAMQPHGEMGKVPPMASLGFPMCICWTTSTMQEPPPWPPPGAVWDLHCLRCAHRVIRREGKGQSQGSRNSQWSRSRGGRGSLESRDRGRVTRQHSRGGRGQGQRCRDSSDREPGRCLDEMSPSR